MLLHLIFYLIRQASKSSGQSALRAPEQRKVKSADIVLHCPACDTLGVGESSDLETNFNGRWLPQMELYTCGACGKSHNAALFKNDGSGVMVVNSWPCPSCGAQVPATSSDCPNCG